MNGMRDALLTRLDLDDGLESPAATEMRRAWKLEKQAEQAEHIDAWAELHKQAIDAWAAAYRLFVPTQDCRCGKDGVLCPGGAACRSVPKNGRCPVCGGPAKVCKPRHAAGRSCG